MDRSRPRNPNDERRGGGGGHHNEKVKTYRIKGRDGREISVLTGHDRADLDARSGEADRRVLIMRTDMPADKQEHAVTTAMRAFEYHEPTHYSDIARDIKEDFNK